MAARADAGLAATAYGSQTVKARAYSGRYIPKIILKCSIDFKKI
jgi:hypothetical protein